MGLLDRYNKGVATGVGLASENPEATITTPIGDPEVQFKGSSLDLENPNPVGGPINVAYNSQVGSEYKSFTTTQPFTPKNTYIDNLQNGDLIRRASKPLK
tara:strand:+ start:59 stop:358 length:300 start_codon:yes stop_codon:yes gene_type:complete